MVTSIDTSCQLDSFRAQLTGGALLPQLSSVSASLLIDVPVGIGKSHCIDDLTRVAIQGDSPYDIVIVLCPTHAVINERHWVISPPEGVRVVVLRPRPESLCGDLGPQWQGFVQRGLGTLGRQRLCRVCPHVTNCFWPDQYGVGLRGTHVVYSTHTHLNNSPRFVEQLTTWCGAERPLVLIDENDFVMAQQRSTISEKDLDIYAGTLAGMVTQNVSHLDLMSTYRNLITLLPQASTEDLRHGSWRLWPLPPELRLAIQEVGFTRHAAAFRDIESDLICFTQSPFISREKVHGNGVSFAAPPRIPDHSIIFSATTDAEVLSHRLGGHSIVRPFANYKFSHPDTKWYNIQSQMGYKRRFWKNAKQILDFFMLLSLERLRKGIRPLLIAKKGFVDEIQQELTSRLKKWGEGEYRIVSGDIQDEDVNDTQVIPLIHYGMVGTNQFQHFDAAYCLAGYYMNTDAAGQLLQEQRAADFRIPLDLQIESAPARRLFGAENAPDQIYDVHALAPAVKAMMERGVVMQAVGRVRPITKPREIITFQHDSDLDVKDVIHFANLNQARNYFGITTARDRAKDDLTAQIRKLHEMGWKHERIASEVGRSKRTVGRHLRQAN